MNFYFLVEGRRTEKKVYRAWIKIPFPHLTEASSLGAVQADQYFLFSGEGYPEYKKRIVAALDDIAQHGGIDQFFICIDAEDAGVEDKIQEIHEVLSTRPPFANTHIIVHDCCIETWFLGNEKLLPQNPQSSDLREMKQFYDVRTHYPEKMGCPTHYQIRAQYHLAYLRLAFQEHGLSYSKAHPGSVAEKHYFDALLRRATNTGHLASFQRLVAVWRNLGGAI